MRLVVKPKPGKTHQYGIWDLDESKFLANITSCSNRGGQQGYRVDGITKMFSSPHACLQPYKKKLGVE